jgi:hypothetical protein
VYAKLGLSFLSVLIFPITEKNVFPCICDNLKICKVTVALQQCILELAINYCNFCQCSNSWSNLDISFLVLGFNCKFLLLLSQCFSISYPSAKLIWFWCYYFLSVAATAAAAAAAAVTVTVAAAAVTAAVTAAACVTDAAVTAAVFAMASISYTRSMF